MAVLFAIYLSAFWFIHRRHKAGSFLSIGIALLASIAMFIYHADSSLGLNF